MISLTLSIGAVQVLAMAPDTPPAVKSYRKAYIAVGFAFSDIGKVYKK